MSSPMYVLQLVTLYRKGPHNQATARKITDTVWAISGMMPPQMKVIVDEADPKAKEEFKKRISAMIDDLRENAELLVKENVPFAQLIQNEIDNDFKYIFSGKPN